MQDLGKLEWVDPHDVWSHEAADFTPWLAENIDALSEALGMDIELPETERPVGQFLADIVATEVGSDREVVIENQLEETDHTHLGQLITYAAGREARVVVWIAPSFNEAHRSALDWLNKNSLEDVAFFGVRLRVGRIGDSPPAPYFEVVSSPDEWTRSRSSRSSTEVPPLQRRRQQFFLSFLEALNQRDPSVTNTKKAQAHNCLYLSAGRGGFQIWLCFGGANFRIALNMGTQDRDANKEAFDVLAGEKSEIEAEMSAALDWQRRDEKLASQVVLQWDGEVTDLDAQEAELIDWAVEKTIAFHTTFVPRVRDL